MIEIVLGVMGGLCAAACFVGGYGLGCARGQRDTLDYLLGDEEPEPGPVAPPFEEFFEPDAKGSPADPDSTFWGRRYRAEL